MSVLSRTDSAVQLFGPAVVKINQRESVWRLTPHGRTLGEAMAKCRHSLVGKTAIEIGVGSGVHAIAALKLGVDAIDVTDIAPEALDSAVENAAENGVAYRHVWNRDWMDFDPADLYDLVLCNPPFCKAGTSNRRHFIRQLIIRSPAFLRPGGQLLFVQSGMANFALTERELDEAGFYFTPVYESRGPFRDYYFTEPGFLEDIRNVENGFEEIDGVYIETLRVYLCTKLGSRTEPRGF